MYDLIYIETKKEDIYFSAWGEGVITDARRHPIEAGAMPAGLGRWPSTVEDMWNLEIQGL